MVGETTLTFFQEIRGDGTFLWRLLLAPDVVLPGGHPPARSSLSAVTRVFCCFV